MEPTKLTATAGVVLAVAAVTLAVASLVHFGVTLSVGATTISDPFAGAAIPEAVIAAVVALGAVALLARLPVSRWLTPAATLFALAGTLYGFTVTLRRGEPGDIVYHLALLTMLVAAAALLLLGLTRPARHDSAGST
jgi:hypothetical protein